MKTLVAFLLLSCSLPAGEIQYGAVWGQNSFSSTQKCLCSVGGPCICDPSACQCKGCPKHVKTSPKAKPSTKPFVVPSGLESQDEYLRNRDIGGYSRAISPVKRCVLFFTASWCAPCQQWKATEQPKLEASGIRFGTSQYDNVRVFDADKHPEMLKEWGVKRLPTFIFLDDVTTETSVVKTRIGGPVPAERIHYFLN